jgi:hypothetical protein
MSDAGGAILEWVRQVTRRVRVRREEGEKIAERYLEHRRRSEGGV